MTCQNEKKPIKAIRGYYMIFEGSTEIKFELQAESEGRYKVYAYCSSLATKLNKVLGCPYGKVDFEAEQSEGIFKVDKADFFRINRILDKYR